MIARPCHPPADRQSDKLLGRDVVPTPLALDVPYIKPMPLDLVQRVPFSRHRKYHTQVALMMPPPPHTILGIFRLDGPSTAHATQLCKRHVKWQQLPTFSQSVLTTGYVAECAGSATCTSQPLCLQLA
jgi:hypothetical protein